MTFPARFGAQLDARTSNGTVEVDERRGGSEFVGAINGGGAPLQIYTARGTIRVGRR